MPMHIKIDVNGQGAVFAKTRYSRDNEGSYDAPPIVWGTSPAQVLHKVATMVAKGKMPISTGVKNDAK